MLVSSSGKFCCFPVMSVQVKRLTPSSRWRQSHDLEVQDGVECRLLFSLHNACERMLGRKQPGFRLCLCQHLPAFPGEASHDVRLTLPFSLDCGKQTNKQGLTPEYNEAIEITTQSDCGPCPLLSVQGNYTGAWLAFCSTLLSLGTHITQTNHFYCPCDKSTSSRL